MVNIIRIWIPNFAAANKSVCSLLALFPFCPFALLPFCPFALLSICPFALISHNVLPSNFALALAIYVVIQATFMARARAKFEGKRLCEIRAKGQK